LENFTDIQTGKVVTTVTGQKWECIDITIEEKYYNLSLVIVNTIGEKTTVPYDAVIGKWGSGRAYTITQVDSCIKKFGNEDFDRILKGKIVIGMTSEMCKLSWRKPNKVSEIIKSGKKYEQWIYKDNSLYFYNGILTTIE
jgi:hypothetical protein